MPEYEVEFMCEHIETVTITAKNKEEAIKKIENGEYEKIIDWHLDGNRIIQSISKNGKELKF